jgi:outer membrane protein TolC
VRTLRETIGALDAERVAAQAHYEALQTSYRTGAATNVELLTGLRDLNQVRTALTAARYDYQVARRNLERAQSSFAAEWVDAPK